MRRRGAKKPVWDRTGVPPAGALAALRVRTLADMTEDEICALEVEYGCPVIRPKGRRRRRAAVAASYQPTA